MIHSRLIGLCLLQNELFPLPLCRHVIKYILNRSIRWHDLAFFDSTMYENLRRLAADMEKDDGQAINELNLTFSVKVTEKEVRYLHSKFGSLIDTRGFSRVVKPTILFLMVHRKM